MRLVVGIALIDRGVTRLWGAPPIQVIILCVLETGAGALLFVGLWTPVAGTLVAAVAVMLANLVVDILYAYVNPRIRYD